MKRTPKRDVNKIVEAFRPYLEPHPGVTVGELSEFLKFCREHGLSETPEDFARHLTAVGRSGQLA